MWWSYALAIVIGMLLLAVIVYSIECYQQRMIQAEQDRCMALQQKQLDQTNTELHNKLMKLQIKKLEQKQQ